MAAPSPAARAPRVVVIGGSLGGLLAANMLWRAGCDVTVHERIGEELSGRGAGIAAHPEMFAAFAQAGVDVNDAIGTSVEERVVLARDGSVTARHRLPQIMCSWSSLLALLRAAFPADRYFAGMEFSQAEQNDAGVRARFADGRAIEADLLIGADGIYSAVRGQYWPQAKPVYAGYVAWRGMVPEAAVSRETHDALFSLYAFCLPPGEHMLGYPITGEDGDLRAGHRRYNIVWYRRVEDDGALRRLMTDEAGKHHPLGIPPGLIRAEAVAELRAAAEANLASAFREMVGLIETPFFRAWSIWMCRRWFQAAPWCSATRRFWRARIPAWASPGRRATRCCWPSLWRRFRMTSAMRYRCTTPNAAAMAAILPPMPGASARR